MLVLFATAVLLGAAAPAKAPERLVVLDFVVQGTAPHDLARALGDVAAAQAASLGAFTVVSTGDVAAQLGLERGKQMLGCAEDEACMVEIAGALAADKLLAGTVTLIDNTYLVAVKLIEVRRSRTLARTGDTLKAPTQAELVDGVRRLAHEALTGRKLDTTGVLRIEVPEAGARVALDGRGLGESPLPSGQRVIEGEHRITVQKIGFVTWAVAAGSTVPVSVTLVPVSAFEAERRVFVEIFGGFTTPSHYSASAVDNCRGGCVGNLGGVRGGYMFGNRFGLELFLVPFMYLNHEATRTVTVRIDTATATAPGYVDAADVGATFGGVSAHVQFFERTPLILRLWAGAVRGSAYARSGGRFPDAPPDSTGHYDHGNLSQSFWSPVFGPEVRFGYRFSRGVSMDAGIAALVMTLPSTIAETGTAIQDQRVQLPPGPAFKGGAAWFFPVTLAVRFDL
jgi:hypothetical protein